MSLGNRIKAAMQKHGEESEALAEYIEENCIEWTYGVIPIGPLSGRLLASSRSAPRIIIRIKQVIGIHPYKVGAGGTLQPYNALTGRYVARSQTISGRLNTPWGHFSAGFAQGYAGATPGASIPPAISSWQRWGQFVGQITGSILQ